MTRKILTRIGFGLLLIPLLILLLFTFGEVFSGDISGLSHILQAVPILILVFLAYKKPFIGGIILMLLGVVPGVLYASRISFNFWTIFLTEIFLFAPVLFSGLAFILSSKIKGVSQHKMAKKGTPKQKIFLYMLLILTPIVILWSMDFGKYNADEFKIISVALLADVVAYLSYIFLFKIRRNP